MIPPRVVGADPENSRVLEEIAGHLERGGLLGYPTETVYGLGARVDDDGIRSLRELKGRGEAKPFLVLIPGPEAVPEMGLVWSRASRRLADAFWPGPVTLVLPDPEERQPSGVRGPTGGVAVRWSPQPFIRALMAVWGAPLLSTSANVTGGGAARTTEGLRSELHGRPGEERLWIADAGPLPGTAPSTLVDCTKERPGVLREGAVSRAELRREAPELDWTSGTRND